MATSRQCKLIFCFMRVCVAVGIYTWLSISTNAASNGSSPDRLVRIALKVALAVVKESHSLARNCTYTWRKHNKPTDSQFSLLERQAVEDCINFMDSAKDQLDAAVANLSSVSASNAAIRRDSIDNLNVWLSASLSFQSACADGFSLVRASISKCQGKILSHQQQVSKALVNALLSVKKELTRHPRHFPHHHQHRRLLQTETSRFPHWWPLYARKIFLDNPAFFSPAAAPSPGAVPSEAPGPSSLPFPSPTNVPTPAPAPLSTPAPKPVGSDDKGNGILADMIVAQDGTGHFETINDALASILSTTRHPGQRFTLYIKQGVYEETVIVPKTLENLTFVGDGMGATIITGSNNVGSGLYNTFRTATVGISANGFMARGITFQNTAGPSGYQSVALRASADYVVFYRCAFKGYQDTLYALSSRQFYKNCHIYGTIDFIFGNAIAVFQDCDLIARRPLPGQQNTYTAQGRKVEVDISGFSFQNCRLVADAELQTANFSVSTYLGRPWKDYSRTVFLNSFIDGLVHPAGWLSWNSSNPFTNTVFYGEYDNRGPGSRIDMRIGWAGVHPNMTAADAAPFTADNFIIGSTWLPFVQVEYTSGLQR